MSKTKKFIKNTTILVVAKAFQPLATFFLIITISQKYGLEVFGVYSTIFKYVPIFQIIAGFGLRSFLVREIAQNPEVAHKYVSAATYVALITAFIGAISMSFLVNLISNNPLVIYGTVLASIALFASGLSDVYEGVIGGFEELKQVGYALFAENVFRVGLSLFLIYNGFGIIVIVLVFVIGQILKTIFFYIYINRKLTKTTGKFDKHLIFSLFKQAKTFALIMVSVTIYWNIDGIMLESMRSAEEVSYYSAAYRFLMMSMVLVHSYVFSLYPIISNYYKTSKAKFEIACRKSLRILMVAVIPIIIALSLLAERVILFLFKENFLPSVKVLQVLIWALIPYVFSQIFAYSLIACNRQNIDLLVNVISMFLNVSLNFFLIPKFGFIGATIATLISINFYVVLQVPFVVQKLIHFKARDVLKYGLKIIVAGILMGSSIIVMKDMNLFVILTIASLLYLGSLFLLGLITESDKQMLLFLKKSSA